MNSIGVTVISTGVIMLATHMHYGCISTDVTILQRTNECLSVHSVYINLLKPTGFEMHRK